MGAPCPRGSRASGGLHVRWRRYLRWVIGLGLSLGLSFYGLCLLRLGALRVVPPPLTMVQLQRSVEAWWAGGDATRRYQYVPLAQIADLLPWWPPKTHGSSRMGALIGGNSPRPRRARHQRPMRFQRAAAGEEPVSHHASVVPPQGPGVHADALRRAGTRQAAHSGSLPDVVEWGPGVCGAEAAARYYYQTSAAALTREARRPPRGGAAGAPPARPSVWTRQAPAF